MVKRLFLIFSILILLFCGSCITIKLNKFNDFLESDAMDVEVWFETESISNEKLFDLKFNQTFIGISVDKTNLFFDKENQLIFLEEEGTKLYTSINGLIEFDEETDFKKYVLNVEKIDEQLSFEFDINSYLIDNDYKTSNEESISNIKCLVSFEKGLVVSISFDALPLLKELNGGQINEKDVLNIVVKVNSYGKEIEGFETPNKTEYKESMFMIFYLYSKLSEIKEKIN